MTRFKCHRRSPPTADADSTIGPFSAVAARLLRDRVPQSLCAVRRLFGSSRDFGRLVGLAIAGLATCAVPVSVRVVALVAVMESLEGEAARSLVALSSSLLRYVRVVLVHCLGAVDVQLCVHPLQLAL